jgi:hypothetical protein
MQPHSLSTTTLSNQKTPAQKAAEAGWAGRHGRVVKGDDASRNAGVACPRVRVADLPEGFLKRNHIDHLEQNQTIASCCRHPENHDVEALKSHPDELVPDIYVFHCPCGKKHRFFCVGMTDERPSWSAS